MTPLIALDLSLDGIVVMSRAPEGPDHGKWWREGIVRLDAPDMAEQLHRMRAACAARVGEEFTTILVIPDSQILFTSLERDDRDPKTTIRALLKGRTPYPVEDLAFDYVQRGDRLQVAVVALETLLEAEGFAADFGFRPVALVGNPQDSPYPGLPDFGPTGIAAELLSGDRLTLGLDEGFTVVAPPALPKAPSPDADPAVGTGPTPQAAPEVTVREAEEPGMARATDSIPMPRPPVRDVQVSEPEQAIILPELTAPRVSPAPPLPPRAVVPPGLPLSAQRARPRVEITVDETETATESGPAKDAAPAPDSGAAGLRSGEASGPVPKDNAWMSPNDMLSDTPAPEDAGAVDGLTAEPEIADVAPSDSPTTPAEDVAQQPADRLVHDAPTFSTRRRTMPAASRRTEPGLTRITSRLSRPIFPPNDTTANDTTANDTPDAAASGEESLAAAPRKGPSPITTPVRTREPDDLPPARLGFSGPRPPLPPGVARPPAPASLPEKASSPLTRLLALSASKAAPDSGAALPPSNMPSRRVAPVEPQSPGVSGLAREAATGARLRTAGGRAGLYATLVVLALLGAVAIWSVAFRGGDDLTNIAGTTDDAPQGATPAPDFADLLPPPVAPGTGTGTGTSIADLPAATPSEGPGPVAAQNAETDLALLLPDSQGGLPSDMSDASPEELAEEDGSDADAGTGADAIGPDPASEDLPEIAVVTTDADPFELPRQIAAAPEPADASEIYLASIDPVIVGGDAVALARPRLPTDALPRQTSPAPAGTAFDTGADGLVVASAAGTLAPGGYSVFSGRPALLPAPRPSATEEQQASESAEEDAARAELASIRPVQRPGDAPERAERLEFDGLTREELTRVRPARRPAAIAELAARAEAASETQAAAVRAAASAAVASLALTDQPAAPPAGAGAPGSPVDATVAASASGSGSRYALARSTRPSERPRSVERDAARIVTQRREEAVPAAAATATASNAPTSADSGNQTVRSAGGSVARAATQSNAIRLREVNLIGVYGSPSRRRALVRLSNGRYLKVEVGDRLERGRVTAIGESEVIYQQGGRSYALRMPQI